ncbi:MAG: hypothetical protein N2037_01670 [Acidimicrobiales bacterium]|nr:hypothetical protein [Acidimicrobiales bacterium]
MGLVSGSFSPAEPVKADTGSSYAMPMRVLLAAFSAGAGAIHLAMVPSHAGNSLAEGISFAIAGWFQVAFAIAIVATGARATKRWLQLGLLANAGFIAAWAMSRTTGLPYGAHAWHPETVGTIDLMCVIFEGVLVLGAAGLLARPSLSANIAGPALAMGSVLPVGVLVAATVAMASPSAQTHAHDSHGDHGSELATGADHDHGDGHDHGHGAAAQTVSASERCDLGFNPVSFWGEHDMVHGGAHDASHGDGFDHSKHNAEEHQQWTEKQQKLQELAKQEGEVAAARLVAELSNVSDEEYNAFIMSLAESAHNANHSESGDDHGGHGGHLGPQAWEPMTDPAECQALANELERARQVALRYPTAKDAMAAGWVPVTPYVPGIAAHFMNFAYVDGKFEIDKPEMILYDGTGPDASVVGLSYYVIHRSETEPDQGFTGPNDHFHRHVGLCVRGGMVVGDTTLSEQQCEAIGGKKQNGSWGWMNHVWVVPGCESPWGMFSGATPVLDMQLGQASGTDGGGCQGSNARARFNLSPGGPSPAPQTSNSGNEVAAAP